MDEILKSDETLVNQSDQYGTTPLIKACRIADLRLVERLPVNKADPNASTRFGDTPLLIACGSNNFELVKILLDHSADPNFVRIMDQNGGPDTFDPPLIAAGSCRSPEIPQLLIKNGAVLCPPAYTSDPGHRRLRVPDSVENGLVRSDWAH